MSKRRPFYLKAVDVLALLLVGASTASMAVSAFQVHTWGFRVFAGAWALAFLAWFASLALEVRYLWTGRLTRLRDVLSRRARPASPSPG